MFFVGRETEKQKIIEGLSRGKNIIITGKFGIGRTSLVREAAVVMSKERRFLFVDFSQTPGRMSDSLMKELGIARRFQKSGKKMGYKSKRFRIATLKAGPGIPIIVFDNIAKLTRQKNAFLRALIEEGGFQYIAICEHFLTIQEFDLLKAQLSPAETVALKRLPAADVESFIRLYTGKKHLLWPEDRIKALAEIARGYPPGLPAIIEAQINNPLT